MPGELDDIIALVDCPKCGTELRVTYKQIRLHQAAGCSCGALIRLEDDTRIGEVQALIDEANPMGGEND
ncbi:hypothetical protein HRJ34_21155 [Rhizorhabdus wittichii]|uniref:Uncharacterized protein n=1 Tax=Rhizorhabdus wittichii TaxID=160791 RepID=A0A975HCX7_9SPHN|nr:hypothetical protein [Rhizorhabdus wittichii]QTH20806.1 hypothetical protein HRJ34_21155 [Rhizorhabdus wittichii]